MLGGSPMWGLSRTALVTASIVLAVFVTPVSVRAENLGEITTVTHGGHTIVPGEEVYRSDFSSITSNWTFTFPWPSSVPNGNAMLAVIRGTFGNIAGGTPQSGVNFDANFQAWGAGTNSVIKSIGIPSLGGLAAQTGTYTVLVAHTNGTFNQNGTMQWFASGGALGQEPVNYRMMTFTYTAQDVPTELPGALASIQYGPRSITASENVEQKDVSPDVNNPSQFWRFNFAWPTAVPNQQALFVVFKGTYGALDGGVPISGTNYSATVQAWASGTNNIGKFMSLPGLETEGGLGTYTVLVAERDPKFSANSTDQEVLWFSSGGAQGVAPKKYSLLTFTLTNPPKCCSSVLFIPGLKGSRLTFDGDTLWPPTALSAFSQDIEQLELNSNGESVNDVRVDGVLDSFYGIPVYAGFTSYLDQLVVDGLIKDWEPLPYDWRLAPETIVQQGVKTESAILNLADEVERLAGESLSKKVMIVSHSYGGLVGKALIKELEQRGEADLVETFFLVGSPQLGTPQAVASILHGAGEGILGGIIANPASTRAVAQNMESAYHLLPSQEYFARVDEPVITFDENSTFANEWRLYWGPGIGSFIDFFGFMSGAGVTREDPMPAELHIPEILSPVLLSNANSFHTEFDTFEYPENIKVVEIAGWGLPTLQTVNYQTEHFAQSYHAVATIEGDGTVVYSSSINSPSGSYFFNLFEYNKLPGSNYQHRNLLNAVPVQLPVHSLLVGESVLETPYLSTTKPLAQTVDDMLVVSTYSPVVIGATDSQGRYTGIDLTQDLGADYLSIKEEIPGSHFLSSGESNSVYLPDNGVYTFIVKGVGVGPASIELSTFSEASTTLAAKFTDIPVTSSFTGIFDVMSDSPRDTELQVDSDSDGVIESIIESDLKKHPLTVVAESKNMVLHADLPLLSAYYNGFVSEDIATSTITGNPVCSTTATPLSPVGQYQIVCSVGTLSSTKYEFTQFADGVMSVRYDWKGFLKPINALDREPSVFKAGTTVPVKFKLFDSAGVEVQAATPPLWLTPEQGDQLSVQRNEKKRHKKGTQGEAFRWDKKDRQYIFNWDTKGVAKGYWYEIGVLLDDGTLKTISVGLR